jgi:hypothetical protein
MRRRLFNLFAFVFLACAVYLVAFTKEEHMQSTSQTAHALNDPKTAIVNTSPLMQRK